MKKVLTYFVILISLIAISFSVTPQTTQADEGWKIESFDSRITLHSDGIVSVIETLNVDFNEAKHGIYRDLPLSYSNNGSETGSDIRVNTVEMDQKPIPYDQTSNRANLQLKIGDPDKSIDGHHTYRITYTVKGVLKHYGVYDELYWNVTGHEWPVAINRASAAISLPGPEIIQFNCYKGEFGSASECDSEKTDDQTIRFSASELSSIGEGMTVAVGYTAGLVPILTVDPPQTVWQAIGAWPSIFGFVVTFVVGTALILKKWWQRGRDKWYGHKALAEGPESTMPLGAKESIAPELSSPTDLRPAELGTLVDEQADTLDVTSTIVDLASRGYLTITEEAKKWRFGSNDYLLTQKKKSDEKLLKYEKILLDALFSKGGEIRLSDLKNSFYDDLAKVKSALYDEVVKKGLFTTSPESVRNLYIGFGIGILILGIILLIVGLTNIISVLIGSGAGLSFLGVLCLIFSNAMPARTAKGRHLYRQARGYELFINSAEKYPAQFAERENLFTEVLPYAIVFGATKKLAKAMEVLHLKPPQPNWYYGVHPFHASAFAVDVNHFSSTLSSAMASSPSSSGSGGGGSSGGGFGGGGGGSW